MSAQILRDAATKLREAAEAATEGPWVVSATRAGNLIEAVSDTVLDTDDVRCGSYCLGGSSTVSLDDPDATYIALANPVFGLAVADWLDDVAGTWHWDRPDAVLDLDGSPLKLDDSTDRHALAVARSIIGDPS